MLVIPIWTVVFFNREQDIRNREGDEMKCQESTSVMLNKAILTH